MSTLSLELHCHEFKNGRALIFVSHFAHFSVHFQIPVLLSYNLSEAIEKHWNKVGNKSFKPSLATTAARFVAAMFKLKPPLATMAARFMAAMFKLKPPLETMVARFMSAICKLKPSLATTSSLRRATTLHLKFFVILAAMVARLMSAKYKWKSSLQTTSTTRRATALQLKFFVILAAVATPSTSAASDSWTVVVSNCGINAMHMTTTHTNKVIMFDRTDWGISPLPLPHHRCRHNSHDSVTPVDCSAHSIRYDSVTNAISALFLFSDTFCSSGAFYPNGTLQQTGGDHAANRTVRTIGAGENDDWVERDAYLFKRRWYATNQILPDGRIIVVGGAGEASYEFVPKSTPWPIWLPLLSKGSSENNLYPFVHLTPSGHLFIFANVYSVLWDYKNGKVVKTYPDFGKDPRVYPYSGTSVMLPVTAADGFEKVEILICGGAPLGSYAAANASEYWPALDTCGRIEITSESPWWRVEKMPSPRVLGDGMLLPTGEVLIVNGAKAGLAGWNMNREPAFSPILYNAGTHKFVVQTTSGIARMYHSTANVQADGTVLIGGSNDQGSYNFSGVRFPTELRLEKYSPYYLSKEFDDVRLTITTEWLPPVRLGGEIRVAFTSRSWVKSVQISLYSPSFTTHANSMNQRMVILNVTAPGEAQGAWEVVATAPTNANVTPPGWYMLTALNTGVTPAIPSKALWAQITP